MLKLWLRADQMKSSYIGHDIRVFLHKGKSTAHVPVPTKHRYLTRHIMLYKQQRPIYQIGSIQTHKDLSTSTDHGQLWINRESSIDFDPFEV